MKRITTVLLLSLVTATAQAEPLPTALTPVQTVEAFHRALKSGDPKAAQSLLDEKVQIYEQGWVERSRTEYAEHHLSGDIAFSAATTTTKTGGSDLTLGDLAYVTSESTVKGTFKGKAIASISLETMTLKRTSDGWRIVHIHWSSRDAKKK